MFWIYFKKSWIRFFNDHENFNQEIAKKINGKIQKTIPELSEISQSWFFRPLVLLFVETQPITFANRVMDVFLLGYIHVFH